MNILFLGGTGFLSGHTVEAALSRGHQVTLFHRGKTNTERFPDVEHILGDREQDLHLLQGRQWDAVIDPCGYLPDVVAASTQALASSVGHYTFISTVNAYAESNDFALGEMDEQAPLAQIPEGYTGENPMELYGPNKVLCEQAAEQALPGRVLIIRPGLLIGPWDSSGRFTYWPRRIAQGGEILAPDHKQQPINFVDARDVADFTIRLIEQQQVGIYNVNGPAESLTLQSFLTLAHAIIGSDARYTWVSEDVLTANGVAPWSELPLWTLKEWGIGFGAINFQKAIAAGLTFRPLEETIQDVLAWSAASPHFPVKNVTLTPEKEAHLLHEWHTRSSN